MSYSAQDPPVGGASSGGDDLRERPIGELLKELSQQTSTLVKMELDLAKAEMTEKGKKAGKGAGLLGGGALFGLGAFGAFTIGLIWLIGAELFDQIWVGALIVTLIYGAIAAALALKGKEEVQEATPAVPEQTVETVKEDVEWAKTQTPSARR